MLLCLPFSFYFNEGGHSSLIISGLITIGVGGILWAFSNRNTEKELKKRDGYLVVTLGWIAMPAFGAMPYILSGTIPTYTNAFFETVSGNFYTKRFETFSTGLARTAMGKRSRIHAEKTTDFSSLRQT